MATSKSMKKSSRKPRSQIAYSPHLEYRVRGMSDTYEYVPYIYANPMSIDSPKKIRNVAYEYAENHLNDTVKGKRLPKRMHVVSIPTNVYFRVSQKNRPKIKADAEPLIYSDDDLSTFNDKLMGIMQKHWTQEMRKTIHHKRMRGSRSSRL